MKTKKTTKIEKRFAEKCWDRCMEPKKFKAAFKKRFGRVNKELFAEYTNACWGCF